MGPKVIIDTNVVMSGLGWQGPSDHILELVEDGKLEFFISLPVLQEYLRVVQYPKFCFTIREQKKLLALVATHARLLTVSRSIVACVDPSDNKFLELAEAAKADFLITGDTHLLELKRHKGTKIVTPKAFLCVLG